MVSHSGGLVHHPKYYHVYHRKDDGIYTEPYVRYIDGKPEYRFWDNAALQAARSGAGTIIACLVVLVLIGAIFVSVMISHLVEDVGPEKPVEEIDTGEQWEMMDDAADCFSAGEEQAMEDTIRAFARKSGILIRITTVTEEEAAAYADDGKYSVEALRDWASDHYFDADTFRNDWLIAFAPRGGRMDYSWIEGSNTPKLLTKEKEEEFREILDADLENPDYTEGQAVDTAIRDFSGRIMRRVDPDWTGFWFDFTMLIFAVVIMIFVGVNFIYMAAIQREYADGGFHRLDGPEMRDLGKGRMLPVMVSCRSCGREISSGEIICPYCQESQRKKQQQRWDIK